MEQEVVALASNIRQNAAILAMNGGFISHYWQKIRYRDIMIGTDGLGYGIIADGRGGTEIFIDLKEVAACIHRVTTMSEGMLIMGIGCTI